MGEGGEENKKNQNKGQMLCNKQSRVEHKHSKWVREQNEQKSGLYMKEEPGCRLRHTGTFKPLAILLQ